VSYNPVVMDDDRPVLVQGLNERGGDAPFLLQLFFWRNKRKVD
jgi:hypothetical protein